MAKLTPMWLAQCQPARRHDAQGMARLMNNSNGGDNTNDPPRNYQCIQTDGRTMLRIPQPTLQLAPRTYSHMERTRGPAKIINARKGRSR
jgi:hypothetical protein